MDKNPTEAPITEGNAEPVGLSDAFGNSWVKSVSLTKRLLCPLVPLTSALASFVFVQICNSCFRPVPPVALILGVTASFATSASLSVASLGYISFFVAKKLLDRKLARLKREKTTDVERVATYQLLQHYLAGYPEFEPNYYKSVVHSSQIDELQKLQDAHDAANKKSVSRSIGAKPFYAQGSIASPLYQPNINEYSGQHARATRQRRAKGA